MGRKIQRPQVKIAEEPKRLRYVIYVRKSSEGKDAQAQSIPDQIRFCKEYAVREQLEIIGEPIEESASAWTANNRPEFTQILADIASQKYDGILCWHPDRLSRNMLESGMIMDMLDSGIMKDLKFVTMQFTNNAAGKLLLNVLFAIAKNYTDGQSENISRGVQTNFKRGGASASKWGYERDEITGHYKPHPHNFKYIKQGWQMLLDGNTQKDVVEYWMQQNVHRMTKINRRNKTIRKITISKQMASNIFSDPFYFGILIQNDQEVDLTKITNFTPMIDEETYNAVQDLTNKKSRILKYSQKKTFYPFRGMVFCSVCHGDIPMRVGKNRSANGTYGLTFRCDNKDCTRKPKSVRSKYILEDLYKTLECLKFTEKEYRKYSETIDGHTEDTLTELRIKRRSLMGREQHIKHSVDERSRQFAALPINTPEITRETLIKDLEQLQDMAIGLRKEISQLDSQIKDPAQIKLSKEEFLNLANTAADKMKAGTPVEKDILARKLLLNIYLDNERAPSYLWKEPYNTLLKSKQIHSGARERT